MLSLLTFDNVIGMNNNFFNAVKVFKTKVTRNQRNCKDNTKITYCPWFAVRRFMTESILNNLELV